MTIEDTVSATTSGARTLGSDGLFLVWGPPRYGPRSRVFARELGIDVSFVQSTGRRGAAIAPFKYASQAVKTALLLRRRRPRVVFVQSPPTPAVVVALVYGRLTGAHAVVDAHSAAMLSPFWTRPGWLFRWMARHALATIVTNDHFAVALRAAGGRALVIRDVPTEYGVVGSYPVERSFNLMVVNSFASDEPLGEVIEAARGLDGVTLYVTGRPGRADAPIVQGAPENVRFTGFLPDDRYYALMGTVDAVVCLTTRDHTMQRGACEALWVGRPIVTSDWPLLAEYFGRGTVHVQPEAAAIRAGIEAMRRNHTRFESEIEGLRAERRREWRVAREALLTLVDSSLRPPTENGVRSR